eukprot:4068077-Prymnesium_polylepis.1
MPARRTFENAKVRPFSASQWVAVYQPRTHHVPTTYPARDRPRGNPNLESGKGRTLAFSNVRLADIFAVTLRFI